MNALCLRAIPTSQLGAHKIATAFRNIPDWLKALDASGTLFEQVDLDAVTTDYDAEPEDAESAPGELTGEPAQQNVQPAGSLAAAVSTWCSGHNTTAGESVDQQRQQALELIGPHIARQAILAQRKAAAAASAAEEQRRQQEDIDRRAEQRAAKEYVVEKIVDKRVVDDVVHYRVKWLGYSGRRNTWEPEANLENSRKCIAQFEAKRKSKKAKVK